MSQFPKPRFALPVVEGRSEEQVQRDWDAYQKAKERRASNVRILDFNRLSGNPAEEESSDENVKAQRIKPTSPRPPDWEPSMDHEGTLRSLEKKASIKLTKKSLRRLRRQTSPLRSSDEHYDALIKQGTDSKESEETNNLKFWFDTKGHHVQYGTIRDDVRQARLIKLTPAEKRGESPPAWRFKASMRREKSRIDEDRALAKAANEAPLKKLTPCIKVDEMQQQDENHYVFKPYLSAEQDDQQDTADFIEHVPELEDPAVVVPVPESFVAPQRAVADGSASSDGKENQRPPSPSTEDKPVPQIGDYEFGAPLTRVSSRYYGIRDDNKAPASEPEEEQRPSIVRSEDALTCEDEKPSWSDNMLAEKSGKSCESDQKSSAESSTRSSEESLTQTLAESLAVSTTAPAPTQVQSGEDHNSTSDDSSGSSLRDTVLRDPVTYVESGRVQKRRRGTPRRGTAAKRQRGT